MRKWLFWLVAVGLGGCNDGAGLEGQDGAGLEGQDGAAQLGADAGTDAGPDAALRPVERRCDPSLRWSSPLVPLERLQGISPLGYQNGDSHILPLHVVYFEGRRVPGPGDEPALDPAVVDTPLVVPGPVTIASLEVARDNGDGVPGEDWFIVVRLCRDARVRFHHMNRPDAATFAGIDLDALRDGTWPGSRCQRKDGVLRSCALIVDRDVPAGTVLGTVFRPGQAPFNLSVYRDPFPGDGLPAHGVDGSVGTPIRPERYHVTWADLAPELGASLDEALFRELNPSRSRGRCPLDVFDDPQRAAHEALVGAPLGEPRRVMQPVCGTIFSDEPGALVGAWFPVGVMPVYDPTFFNERKALTLVTDVIDPAFEVVLAPSLTGARSRQGFRPDSGRGPTRQQRFRDVRFGAIAPEPVYCWDGLGGFSVGAPEGKLLVRFEAADRIEVGWVAGAACAEDEPMPADAQRFER